MSRLTSDARHAWRKLVRSPGFTVVSALTLALGIGATTAIFSVVNGVLLKSLPYPEPERLVGLWHTAPGLGVLKLEQSDGSYLLYHSASRVLENSGSYMRSAVNLTGGAEAERLLSADITASLLPTMRVVPIAGRTFSEADDRPGAAPVMLVSEALWTRKFGRDPSLVGRTLQVNGRSREVIGILPARFQFPEADTKVWLPMGFDPSKVNAANFSYGALARLKPGITAKQAQADLQRLLVTLPVVYPGLMTSSMLEEAKMKVVITSLRDDIVGDIGGVLWVVLGTVGFVLLIACANVANLFLVRAESRQKEIGVRTALGAGRGEVIRQFLVEGMVLAAIGGAAGVALAAAAVRLLPSLASQLPRIAEVGIDARVMVVAMAVTIVSAILFSALPALRYGTPNLNAVLKEGGRAGTSSRERRRVRSALVVVQVALALVLLAGSGLMA
ncbi:MAG: ABC transporter permease, partial [Gemmatimonadaceae bacterium]